MSLHINSVAPDFAQDSTHGRLRFHEWLGDSWGVLFSHPKDFTPVCTTELGTAARLGHEFARRKVRIAALSVDPLEAHQRWLADVEDTQQVKVGYPVFADADRTISNLYDMIHPEASDTFTVRSVFVIDPQKKIRATITYPASAGRNFAEILRLIDSLQLTDGFAVSTPADWQDGDDVVIAPSIQDPAELERRFPKGWNVLRPYLRMTPQPNR